LRTHRFPRLAAWLTLGLLWLTVILPGCDYSAPAPTTVVSTPDSLIPGGGAITSEHKGVILKNVLELIRTAAMKPGGDNFRIATENLNQYFNDIRPSDFALKPEDRAALLQQFPAAAVADLENPMFRTRPDARHLEDCMLYHAVATRIGGVGDDLSRVRRVFRWIIEQIQLVPAGSLGAPGLGQAAARPYDVLMRGMATESQGFWAERGWLFLVLCRQLGVDAGLLTYTAPQGKDPVIWICTALIDGKLYLFDARIGMEVPLPEGHGGGKGKGKGNGNAVATLEDALRDPRVLNQLDLPGQSPYGTTRAALLGSSSKIGVLLDSSLDYRSPRMAMLQKSLAGEDRTILYRSPADEHDRFVRALGAHAGKVAFWELPAQVETLLFNEARFREATMFAQALFEPNRYPLIYARIKQLRGDTAGAVQDYVSFRFAENLVQLNDKKPTPKEVQEGLDIYATYFLGLCHLERGQTSLARSFFEQTLKLLPEYGPGRPYFTMFRWGAQANLGRICAAEGDDARAIAYFTQADPTTQSHGNLLAARALVWRDPTAPLPPDLPPAPVPNVVPPMIKAQAPPP
jgi:hypothetical protein